MHAVTIFVVKGRQFSSRLWCTQGTIRVLKSAANCSPVERLQEKKEWWRTGMRNAFGKYLVLTNTLSSGFLMAVADLMQQEIEYVGTEIHKDSFDWRRNRNMGMVGTLQGFLSHFFYQLLDKYFPGVKLTTIMKKIFLDQTLASPFFILLFFGGMNYLNNESYDASKTELKEKFWKVYAVDCSIWIPAQFFNFYCLSTKYRVLYMNILTTCYNIFLSYMKHAQVGAS